MFFHAPHFHPHFHAFPFVFVLLMLAAFVFVMRRPHLVASCGRSAQRFGSGLMNRTAARSSAPPVNSAFEAYRSEKIAELEKEAADFRAHLDKLRHAEDQAAFEAFLKARKAGGTPPPPADKH